MKQGIINYSRRIVLIWTGQIIGFTKICLKKKTGIYDSYLGQQNIPLAAGDGAFAEISFLLPSKFFDTMNSNFNDAKIKIVVNTDDNYGSFNLDNLLFITE
ncbi:MAG: hypothetical protein ACLFVE_15745 [Chitinispirillaceae bacterium]